MCVCCLQGQGHREVGEGVRMSGGICVCVLKEIITLAINAPALPPSLLGPPSSSPYRLLRGGPRVVTGFQERQLLIWSREDFPSSYIRARKASPLSSFGDLFFIVHQQCSRHIPRHPFKTGGAIFDIPRALLSAETRMTRGNGE